MSDIKDIRKQVRNVTQEILGEVLTQELVASIRKEVMAHLDARLDAISKHIKSSLDQIDSRSKDVQSFIVRNTAPTAPKQD